MQSRIELISALALVAMAGCKATFGDVGPGAGPDDAGPDAAADAPVDAGGQDAAPCPASATQVQDPATGHCYTRFLDPLPWNAAQEACAALGPTTHLAVSTSQEENDVFSPLAGLADVWIGGTDFLSEDEFIWLNLEPMVFVNFRDGEPNNGNGNGEDCMVLEGDNGGVWDDRRCESSFTYICERE